MNPHERKRLIAHAYDCVSKEYDGDFRDKKSLAEDWWITKRLRRLGVGQGGTSVLDVGCGTGLLLECMPEIRMDRYLGYDISPGMIEQAKRKFATWADKFFVDDMDDPVQPMLKLGAFASAVCLWGSFSYAVCPDFAAYSMLQAVQHGGRIFVVALAPRHLDKAHYVLAQHGAPKTLRNFYTPASLGHLFKTHGATEIKTYGFCYYDRLPRWLHAITPRKVVDAALSVETAVLGTVAPSKSYYVILEAKRA